MAAILLVMEKVGILFVMIAVGFICTKIGMLTHKGIAEITSFLLRIVTPCLIVSSFLSADSGVELPVLGISVLTAVLAHVLAIVLSLFTFRKTEPDRQKTLRFAVIFSNTGFMGMPLVQSVVGDSGVVYASVYIAVFNLFCWTYGYSMMSGGKRASLKTALLNPGVIGLVIGVPIYLLGISLPEPVLQPVQGFAALNTPLAMVVVGSHIAAIEWKSMFTDWQVYAASALRLIVAPLLFLGAMLLLRPEYPLFVGNVIQSAAPVAANAVLFSTQFGRDARLASKVVALSTLLSIITLPLFTVASEMLI